MRVQWANEQTELVGNIKYFIPFLFRESLIALAVAASVGDRIEPRVCSIDLCDHLHLTTLFVCFCVSWVNIYNGITSIKVSVICSICHLIIAWLMIVAASLSVVKWFDSVLTSIISYLNTLMYLQFDFVFIFITSEIFHKNF